MAIHAPITGAPLRAPLLPTFTLANRRDIENEIERLIGLLDAADAPLADLEPEDEGADYTHFIAAHRCYVGEVA